MLTARTCGCSRVSEASDVGLSKVRSSPTRTSAMIALVQIIHLFFPGLERVFLLRDAPASFLLDPEDHGR
jgi:hypothetical protein